MGLPNFKRRRGEYYMANAALQTHAFATVPRAQRRAGPETFAVYAGIYPLDRFARFAQGARSVEETAWHHRQFS